MARIPYVEPETAGPEVRAVLEQLPVKLNIFKMMGHAETSFTPLLRLGGSILGQQKLDARLRELAILRVAKLSESEYEWVQHVPIARHTGAGDAEIEAVCRRIEEIDPETPLVLQPVTPFAAVKETPDAARLLGWLRRCEKKLSNVRLIPQTHRLYGAL